MGFTRAAGIVTITISEDDCDLLNQALGSAFVLAQERGSKKLAGNFVRLANAIHEGDPDWTPYEVEARPS